MKRVAVCWLALAVVASTTAKAYQVFEETEEVSAPQLCVMDIITILRCTCDGLEQKKKKVNGTLVQVLGSFIVLRLRFSGF